MVPDQLLLATCAHWFIGAGFPFHVFHQRIVELGEHLVGAVVQLALRGCTTRTVGQTSTTAREQRSEVHSDLCLRTYRETTGTGNTLTTPLLTNIALGAGWGIVQHPVGLVGVFECLGFDFP